MFLRMGKGSVILLAMLMLSVGLAGCASQEAPSEGSDGASDPDPAGDGSDGSTDGDGTGSDDGTDTEGEQGWEPFQFGEPVVTEGGEQLGSLSSYTYTVVRVEDGGRREVRVSVTYDGVVSQEVRSVKQVFDPDTGEPRRENVSNQVEVHALVQEITVLEDSIGGVESSTAATVRTYIPVGESGSGGGTGGRSWAFVKMDVELEDQTIVVEHVLTDEMRDEMANGTMYVPYTEGSIHDWWGWDEFALLYSAVFLNSWADGSGALDEGEHRESAGTSWAAKDAMIELGEHTFDGTEVTWSTEGSAPRSWRTIVSPGLPVPYLLEWDYENKEGVRQAFTYELVDLEI